MTEGQPEQFELVFDGPLDESPDTLRRLKGVFIAELEFTIDQTIQALQKFPVTIKRSDTEQSLTRYYNVLQGAGAKVLLVKPKQTEAPAPAVSEPVGIEDSELWEMESLHPDKLAAHHSDEDVAPITLEFNLDPVELNKAQPTPKTTHVFELTEDVDLQTALKEAEAIPEVGSAPAEPPLDPVVAAPVIEEKADPIVEPALIVADEPEPVAVSIEPVVDLGVTASPQVTADEAPLPSPEVDALPPPTAELASQAEVAPISGFSFDLETSPAAPQPTEQPTIEAKTEAAPMFTFESATVEVKPEEPTPVMETPAAPPPVWNLELEVAPDDAPQTTAPQQTDSQPESPKSAQEFLLSTLSLDDSEVKVAPPAPPEASPAGEPEPVTVDLTVEAEPATAAAPPTLPIEQQVSAVSSALEPTLDLAVDEEPVPATVSGIDPAAAEVTATSAAIQEEKTPGQTPEKTVPTDATPVLLEDPAAPLEISPSEVKSKNKLFGLPMDLVAPIAIGAILLGAANWWVFSTTPEAPEIEIAPGFSPMSPKGDEAPIPVKPATPPVGYLGSGTVGDMPSELKIVAVGEKLRTIRFSFVPPAPPELTPEEIVDGKPRDPWVKRIDIDDLRITNQPQGAFEGSGPARITIEDQGAKRYVAQVLVKGTWILESKKFSYTVEIKRESDQTVGPGQFSIVRREFGQYDISVNASGEMLVTQEQIVERADPAPAPKPAKPVEQPKVEKASEAHDPDGL